MRTWSQTWMSRLSFSKKLLPAKRAWRSLTRTLHSKITKLKDSSPIKTTTQRLLSLDLLSRHFIPFRQRSLTKNSSFHHFGSHRYQYCRKTTSPIYINELFDGDGPSPCSNSTQYHWKGETSKATEEVTGKTEQVGNQRGAGNFGYDVDQVWRRIVASSPQLRCVDERAEDFISKFKEDMKLQRERSILEFQEMLNRSA